MERSLFAHLGLGQRDVEVMSLYYFEAWSLADIGNLFGIRKQSVSDRIDKCLRIFRRAGVPEPKRTRLPTLKKKINLDGELLDAVVNGYLPPLIIDNVRGNQL